MGNGAGEMSRRRISWAKRGLLKWTFGVGLVGGDGRWIQSGSAGGCRRGNEEGRTEWNRAMGMEKLKKGMVSKNHADRIAVWM